MPKPKRCDDSLVLPANLAWFPDGVQAFCHRKRGHRGKHCGTVRRELNTGEQDAEGNYIHRVVDVDIWWDQTAAELLSGLEEGASEERTDG